MDIMTAIFSVCGSVVQTVMGNIGGMATAGITMPQEMVDTIESVGFLASIPLWLVSLLGSLFITIMSFILILTVYGRFFRLYFYTALAPLPLASFAGEGTSFAGKAFLKSYIGVCMGGGHRFGLPHFLRLHVQRGSGGGHIPLRRHHELAVHWGSHFQYARPCRFGEGRGADRAGDVWAMRKYNVIYADPPWPTGYGVKKAWAAPLSPTIPP